MWKTATLSVAAALASLAIALAAACGGDRDGGADQATATSMGVVTETPPAVSLFLLPDAEPVDTELARQLVSLAPSDEDAAAAFPDVAPFARELRGELGQEYEHIDLAGRGFAAGYVAFYRPSDESHSTYMTIALFHSVEGASNAFRDILMEWEATTRPGASAFDLDQGDEARGLTIPAANDEPAVTIVALREGRIVLYAVTLAPDSEDAREGMRELARNVVGRIQDGVFD
jgi:hypothetical protein